VSGCVDAVVDGVTGTLVAPRNASRLAHAIGCYLKSADLRQRHGGAARQRALDDFRPDAAWEALCDVFATLLEAQRIGCQWQNGF
jgi:glycosyltransferase involved in cell wall biosynthesis